MSFSSRQRRVLITGLGAITCIGSGKENLWKGILAEKSGFRKLERLNLPDCKAQVAGEIRDFQPLDHFPAKRLKRLDRHSQMALVCARMAFLDAGLSHEPGVRRPRWGASLGTALGGISDAEHQHDLFIKRGPAAINPLLALLIFGGASSSNISIEFGLTGPCFTSSNSCSSGNMALGDAFHAIRNGHADLMFAGASEAPLCPLTFTAFDLIHTMSRIPDPDQACCPFDLRRDGFVMSEGAGILILESEEHALARGARIYGEILGYSTHCDAFHMTSSLESGECAARCMRDALNDAGLSPEQIDYINAHASSTPMNDRNETTAIKLAFGDHAKKVAISGTKAYHGHPLGAAAAIEAVLSTLALENQYIPPTLNLTQPDPSCDLDYTPLHGRKAPLRAILSNSFGFGGVNASLVLGQYVKEGLSEESLDCRMGG